MTIYSQPPTQIRYVYTSAPVDVETINEGTPEETQVVTVAVPEAVLTRSTWYTDEGVPSTVPGATVGDCYLDTATSTVYRLEA